MRALSRVAVIDIGSNSSRVVVFERDAAGHVRDLVSSRASLRLVEDVDSLGELSEATMARATEAVRDFKALAVGAGAEQIVAVATAAVRDAANGALFAERLRRDPGISLKVITGEEEARYGFRGAMRGLPVSNGVLFDLGGGSMQLTRVARRRRVEDRSLPLGALRLSGKFLESDPPTRSQLRRLREYVRDQLAVARVKRCSPGERLVGTGGTLRNLAKIDHADQQYPIRTLQGYELPLDRLAEIVERLASLKQKHRDELPGLSADRSDSIVGGAVAIQTLAEFVRASSILVSNQGVREGLALELLDVPSADLDTVREASVASLVARFARWDPKPADRRARVASSLYRALGPRTNALLTTAVTRTAHVLDIGRVLDITNRHAHVADILLTTELNGFTHAELAVMAAIVRRAGNRHADVDPLAALSGVKTGAIEQAGIILSLADEIEARCAPGQPIAVRSQVGKSVTLAIPALPSWPEDDLGKRFAKAFGRELVVRH